MDTRREFQARLDEMMAGVRKMVREAGDVQKKIFRVTATARSDDGLVTATVGPRGHLIALEIDPRIYRRPDATQLAQTIVDTTRRAVEQVNREIAKLYADLVPRDLPADKIYAGMGLPGDTMLRHDADLLKSREVHDD